MGNLITAGLIAANYVCVTYGHVITRGTGGERVRKTQRDVCVALQAALEDGMHAHRVEKSQGAGGGAEH